MSQRNAMHIYLKETAPAPGPNALSPGPVEMGPRSGGLKARADTKQFWSGGAS